MSIEAEFLEYKELLRLARIGKATEQIFDEYYLSMVDNEKSIKTFFVVEELVEWVEREL